MTIIAKIAMVFKVLLGGIWKAFVGAGKLMIKPLSKEKQGKAVALSGKGLKGFSYFLLGLLVMKEVWDLVGFRDVFFG